MSIAQDRLFDDWMTKSPAIARATVVANDQTLKALSRFHVSLNSKILGLFGVRWRLTMKSTDRQSIMDEVGQLTSANGQLVALLEQMNQHASTDVARRTALNHEFENGQKRVAELLTRHDRLNGELLEEHLRFSRLCNQAVAELAELETPLLASVRAELGLPFDADAYRRIVKEGQDSVAVDLEAFFDDLRSIVKDA